MIRPFVSRHILLLTPLFGINGLFVLQIFTINDQLVLTNTPRTTYNGNLYVLQCYLYPLGTTMTSSEYGANPIVSNLSFT